MSRCNVSVERVDGGGGGLVKRNRSILLIYGVDVQIGQGCREEKAFVELRTIAAGTYASLNIWKARWKVGELGRT